MAGYWPSSFFACINTQKKETRPISSHLDRASLVNKGFIISDEAPKHYLYTCGTKPLSRVGKIAHLVANHNARFGSSCSLTGLGI